MSCLPKRLLSPAAAQQQTLRADSQVQVVLAAVVYQRCSALADPAVVAQLLVTACLRSRARTCCGLMAAETKRDSRLVCLLT